MDQALLARYLTFLLERTNGLLEKDEIQGYHIAVLQRELGDFKRSVAGDASGTSAIKESIRALELNVTDKAWAPKT